MDRPIGMTAANWRTHPHAPWAFRNIDRFLPFALVRTGGTPRPLEDAPPMPAVAIDDGAGGSIDLPAFLTGTHADAFIVAREGRIFHEYYAEGMTPASRHLCFSMTKSLVGLLGEILIARGRIDPLACAGDLVPDLRSSAFSRATLRALLDMVDGVPFDETYADEDAQIHRYSKHFWGDGEGGVLAGLRALPGAADRAGVFAYRTPVSDVVGLMLEHATGEPLEDLLSAHVWQPCGAADDAHWVRDTGGRVIASAGFACTLRDLARVGLWLAAAHAEHGPRTLVAATRSIARGGNRAAFAAGGQPTRPGFSYRSHWWIDHDAGAWNALGVFGQRLHIVPSAGLVIARFGSHPIASNAATDDLHARAFAAIRAALA